MVEAETHCSARFRHCIHESLNPISNVKHIHYELCCVPTKVNNAFSIADRNTHIS